MKNKALEEIIYWLPEFIDPDKNKDQNFTIQINANGEGGGEWGIVIVDGKCEILEGTLNHSDFAITADAQDMLKMIYGELDPFKAYLRGKIKLKGKINQALKLGDLLRIDEEMLKRKLHGG